MAPSTTTSVAQAEYQAAEAEYLRARRHRENVQDLRLERQPAYDAEDAAITRLRAARQRLYADGSAGNLRPIGGAA